MFDVVGLGSACLDVLGFVPHIPGVDEKVRMVETSRQGGGEVGTALAALAKLGSSVAFVGRVGDDPTGAFIKDDFERRGVDTGHLTVEPGAVSPSSVVMVDRESGLRTIVDCGTTVSDVRPEELSEGFIEGAKYLLLDSRHGAAALEAATRARRAGVTVVVDADIPAQDPDIPRLMQLTDILIPSEHFSRLFTETDDVHRSIRALRSLGPSVVLVTLGKEGSVCHSNGETFHTPAFEVDVVDTTGAGDVFHGAFIHGLLRGWELRQAVEFASAVAAIKCRHLGGRAGIPTFEETLEFLAARETRHFG